MAVLLTGRFVLQAILAQSKPHFNGFPQACMGFGYEDEDARHCFQLAGLFVLDALRFCFPRVQFCCT